MMPNKPIPPPIDIPIMAAVVKCGSESTFGSEIKVDALFDDFISL